MKQNFQIIIKCKSCRYEKTVNDANQIEDLIRCPDCGKKYYIEEDH